MDFPVFATKIAGVTESFDLSDNTQRYKYFKAKAGKQIEQIKQYLENNSFVGFLLAKKQAGKGTYSKMFTEIIGSDRFAHLSIGDLVREVHTDLGNPAKLVDFRRYLESNYRGFISIDEVVDSILGRSPRKLIPTEVILTLVRRKMESLKGVALFIDGFPRNLDQISYSLYFREIMNLRDDPDFFILIQIPESVIDARMKARVICPLCNTSRNTRLLPTKFVSYRKDKRKFILQCDNQECAGYKNADLVGKEGDDLGIEVISDRIKADEKLIKMATSLHGVPKVLLRNSVPVGQKDKFDKYELTPAYSYKFDERKEKVNVVEKSWIIKDDKGVDSYSLLAAPVVLSLIYQIHDLLGLGE